MNTKTDYQHTMPTLIDLGLPSGTLWADRNLGADAPEQAGDYYRWGETAPCNHKNQPYGLDDLDKDIAGTQYDAATVNLGEPYRMPTLKQIKELLDSCTWEWTSINGVKGVKVTGPNGNYIFFPASGCRYYCSGSLKYVGSYGCCWSASPSGTNRARSLYFYSDNWSRNYYRRAFGFSVRAVKKK